IACAPSTTSAPSSRASSSARSRTLRRSSSRRADRKWYRAAMRGLSLALVLLIQLGGGCGSSSGNGGSGGTRGAGGTGGAGGSPMDAPGGSGGSDALDANIAVDAAGDAGLPVISFSGTINEWQSPTTVGPALAGATVCLYRASPANCVTTDSAG